MRHGQLVKKAAIMETNNKSRSTNLPHKSRNPGTLLIPFRDYYLNICIKEIVAYVFERKSQLIPFQAKQPQFLPVS